MLKTLRLSFALKNTYRVNGILYSLKQIPLVKKLIPGGVYRIRGFKVFANVLSIFWEILSAFFGKLIYFLLMFAGAIRLYQVQDETEAALFLHILIALSVIGAFANTYMFNPAKDKYYAMILLGMDAKEYTLVNYFYAIGKLLAGFALFGIIFGLAAGLKLWECILIPFFVAGVKLIYAAVELKEYERQQKITTENNLGPVRWLLMPVLLGVAYGFPALGVILPRTVSIGILCLGCILGLVCLRKIFTFEQYRPMYQEILTQAMTLWDPSAQKEVQRKYDQKNISMDYEISSDKKGFEFLNDLFIKRHKKILWSSAKKIAAVVLALIAGLLLLFLLRPDTKEVVNELILRYLPYFVFVMYMINRGTGFTRALFANCDHSLLTYSFYKKPKQILTLFRIRLREIIKINLLPATVIGGGLALLLLASGGTDNALNYVVLVVSIVCLSVFFSVHYLTMYYLLQPYNAGTEIKGGTYQIIMSVTYVVCYAMLKLKLPIIGFGMVTIVFCILYSILACVLVYKIAPRTFRIRS